MKSFKSARKIMITSALIGVVGEASAQKLSLKALLDLSSSVASKVEQPIQDAPGIISVYTKGDIERLGYLTLAELADITPGYSTNIRFGEKGFETRGQGNDGWNNNKHLLIVDGIPVRHVRANRALIEENMAIHGAQRVEFLKGPASALYGVGAFFGVVNVTSAQAIEDGYSSNFRLFSGTENSTSGAFASVVSKNDNSQSRVATSYYRKLASNTPINGDVNRPYQNDNQSIFLNTAHKITNGWAQGTSVGFIYSDKVGGIGEYWGAEASPINQVRWTTAMPYVRIEKDINEKLSLNSYISMTQSSEAGLWTGNPYNHPLDNVIYEKAENMPSVGEYNDQVRSIDAVLEGRYNLNEKNSIITGMNYYVNWGLNSNDGTFNWSMATDKTLKYTQFSIDESFNKQKVASYTYSAYTQYSSNLPVLEGLLLTAGVREDYGTYKENSFSQLSPRLGLVQKLTPEMNFKALYGTALRAPGQKEFNLNDESTRKLADNNIAVKIPSLEAEVISSYEGGLTYNLSNFAGSISGFYNSTTNIIQSYSAAKTAGTDLNAFKNTSGEIKAFGFEADAQYVVDENLRFLTNVAWAKASDTSGANFAGMPEVKVNAGGSYSFAMPFPSNFTLINKWVSGYTVDKKDAKSTDGKNILDAKLSVGITDDLTLDVQTKNLLDEDVKVLSGSGTMIAVDPREFLFGITAKF